MPATQIQFYRFKAGQTEDALDTFRQGKEIGERHGAGNVRAYRMLQGENTSMVYAMLDFESLAAYGQFADQVAQAEDWQRIVTRVLAPDTPLDYLGSWVMTVAGTFGQPIDNPQVTLNRIWDVKPGRMGEFLDVVKQAQPYVEQFGGAVVVYQVVLGGNMSGAATSGAQFPSQEALFGYLDAITSDPAAMAVAAKVVGEDAPATATSMVTAARLPI